MILTEANYHSTEANQKYMSASQYRDFSRCSARAMALIDGRWTFEPTKSMLASSYVDAHFSGTLQQFRTKNPQMYKRDGSLYSEHVNMEAVIERVSQDPVMIEYLTGDWQTIVTGQIAGVPFRSKFDVYKPGERIVDLKVMANFGKAWSDDQGRYVNWVQAWGYDYQMAIYRELGGGLPVYIAAATKETPPDLMIVHMTPSILDTLIAEVRHYAPIYQSIKMGLAEPVRCETCDYCRATKVLAGPVELEQLLI